MVFNDTTTKAGIIQAIERKIFSADYGRITGNALNMATFVAYINTAMDYVNQFVLRNDSTWQWDDTNQTTKPEALITMVNNQRDYAIPNTVLYINTVSIQDKRGDYQILNPIDWRGIKVDKSEFLEESGVPQYYEKVGQTLTLYPAPLATQVTVVNGIKIVHQRQPVYFVSTDTTKEPGIPQTYHNLIVLWASYFYCTDNLVSGKIATVTGEIKLEEDALMYHFLNRQQDVTPHISRAYTDWS